VKYAQLVQNETRLVNSEPVTSELEPPCCGGHPRLLWSCTGFLILLVAVCCSLPTPPRFHFSTPAAAAQVGGPQEAAPKWKRGVLPLPLQRYH
jgi:hypothetical protein